MAGLLTFECNADAFAASLLASVKPLEKKVETRIRNTIHAVHTSLHDKTPVWSGRAIRNYVWGRGEPGGGELDPIPVPPEMGPTNSMPLGAEPRRAANAAASTATLMAIGFGRPWGQYVVVNRAHDIGLLEIGGAPTPERSRQPSGMFALTVAQVMALLNAGAL